MIHGFVFGAGKKRAEKKEATNRPPSRPGLRQGYFSGTTRLGCSSQLGAKIIARLLAIALVLHISSQYGLKSTCVVAESTWLEQSRPVHSTT